MAKLNFIDYGWFLDEAQCPCDVHFVRYLAAEGLRDQAIFHFGTGEHHHVGIACHEAAAGNVVLGITASPREHDFYETLIIERPEVGRSYKVLFGDIYQLEARLLPALDIATLFHIGEFRTEKNDVYGALTDDAMVALVVSKICVGGLILLYSGSYAFDVAERVSGALVAGGILEPAGAFESLRIFRKRG